MNKETLIQLMELIEELNKKLKDPRMTVFFQDNHLYLQFGVGEGTVYQRWTKCINKEDILSRYETVMEAKEVIEMFTNKGG